MNNDLISREALKKALIEAHINRVLTFDIATFNCVMSTINNAPTVTPTLQLKDITDEDVARFAMIWQRATSKGVILEPERPHGKWIKIFENPFVNGYVCPFCGHKIQVTEQFLPEITECEVCGAGMKGWRDVETPQASNNAELFKQTFGIYATELWTMTNEKFTEWLNAEVQDATDK